MSTTSLAPRSSPLTPPMHSIRLRHPWQCEPDGDAYLWSRKFNWPAELAPDERIRLVISPLSTATTVTLNDTQLTLADADGLDVTQLISHHNLLTFTHLAPHTETTRHSPFDVRLDIVGD